MFCLSPFISWNWAILSFSRNIYTILQTSVRWTIIFILKTISKNEQECKIDGVKKILFSCGYRKKRENEAISPYHIYGWAHAPHQSLYHMHEHTPPSISVSHAWAHAPWWSHNWIPIPFVVGFDCPAVAKVRNHLRWLGVIRRPFWFWCSTWIFGRPSWDVGKLLVFAPKLFSSAYGAPFLGLFDATESKILLSRISSG
jgi:hypothetical protein